MNGKTLKPQRPSFKPQQKMATGVGRKQKAWVRTP